MTGHRLQLEVTRLKITPADNYFWKNIGPSPASFIFIKSFQYSTGRSPVLKVWMQLLHYMQRTTLVKSSLVKLQTVILPSNGKCSLVEATTGAHSYICLNRVRTQAFLMAVKDANHYAIDL